jgi:hypothetical protein
LTLCERDDLEEYGIDQRRENQMNVIGHDDRRVQVEGVLILMQAAIECDLASAVGKNPSMVCAEGQKMRLVVALQMGKIAPIKRLRHAHVGADALVCPAERSSALGIIARQQSRI